MILGEIDLSIGAMYCSPRSSSTSSTRPGSGLVPSPDPALLVCVAGGAINGFFVADRRSGSFVTTLGTLFAFEGLALIIPTATRGRRRPEQVDPAWPARSSGKKLTTIGTFAKIFGGEPTRS